MLQQNMCSCLIVVTCLLQSDSPYQAKLGPYCATWGQRATAHSMVVYLRFWQVF